MSNMKRVCPVCSGTKKQFLIRQSFSQVSGNPDLSYDLVLCGSCGVGFADPVPSQKVYDRYYKESSKYEDASGSGRNSELMQAAHNRVVEVVARYAKNKKAGVLDIGCAAGDTLRAFMRSGFPNVFGIDPSPVCKKIAEEKYGIAVEATGLHDFKPEGKYGVVTLSHVLEHIIDMPKAVNKIRSLLEPKGIVYIEIPAAHEFMKKPDGFFEHFSIEHVNYFSPATLEILMNRYGFKKRKMFTSLNKRRFYPAFPVIISVWQKTDTFKSDFRRDTLLGKELKRYIAHCKRATLPIRKKIDALVKSKEKIIVWGAGSHTLKLLENTNLERVAIEAIVDDTASLQGRKVRKWLVRHPQDVLPKLTHPILISSMHFQERIAERIQKTLQFKNKLIRLYE